MTRARDIADRKFADSDSLVFGAGSDLTITHDASDSLITDSGTGNLQIRADDFYVMKQDGSEVMIRADTDSFVKLYYDNAEKLATTSTGIDVTGAVGGDTLNIDGTGSGDIAIIKTSANSGTGLFINSQTANQIDVVGYDGSAATAVNIRSGGASGAGLNVNTSNNVGIGTTSPGVKLEVNGDIKSNGASSSNAQISAVTAGSSNYATLTTTNGARSYSMQVRPDVSNSFVIRDETGGANKFVILTTGEVVINDTARTLACVQHISFDGANEQGLCIKNTANNSSGAAIRFIDHAGNQSGGGIYFTDSNSINYATSSDARLKENVADMTGAIDRVKALAPKRFNFISSPDTTIDGFLAHEAQVVVPEAVIGTENAVDDDDNPVYQAMDAGRLVPLLTGALKEAIAKIETLETEMTALKARVTTLEGE